MPGFADTVEPAVEAGGCRHLAVLVTRADELPAVLASFYALGSRRRGWLVHRALPGRAGQERAVLSAAGLDVASLERAGLMLVHEIDAGQPPEAYGSELERPLEAALGKGLQAMWYARFAVGGDVASTDEVLTYDRHYEQRFAGRPTVTLCPFVVGELGGRAAEEAVPGIAEVHDGVAVPDATGGFALVRREPRAPA